MRLLRHRHTLGILALLALAMQAVLAVAHTHAHTNAFADATHLSKRAITYGMCRVGAERPCPPPAPHDDHSKCPLCWSMGVASAAVLATPPAIALIYPRVELLPPVCTAMATPGVSTVHFQARAPPIA